MRSIRTSTSTSTPSNACSPQPTCWCCSIRCTGTCARPLLKEWIDHVLEKGWAYGTGGTALAGKGFLSAITTGATPEAYLPDGVHYYSVTEFLRPFERTAVLWHLAWLEPQVLQGAGRLPQALLYEAAEV